MAEDDEIDVLGDYNLDLLSKPSAFDGSTLVSQNSDFLNCDYTIHPQWLLDKPSANPALWYSNNSDDISKNMELESQTDTNTENCITDESGWTEKEKDLLNRGIEIFGKSGINLSQFIGSKTPAEVKYFLKNFYSETHNSKANDTIFDGSFIEETVITSDDVELLHDTDIPASMEEVVQTNSNKSKSGSPKKGSNVKKSNSISYRDVPSGQSLLKLNYSNSQEFKNNTRKGVKFKFKTKVNLLNSTALKSSNKIIKKPALKKTVQKSAKKINSSVNKTEFAANAKANTENETKDLLHIVTGKGIGVPVCKGEQVVKIIKESESMDSDSEIEIEEFEDQQLNRTEKRTETKTSKISLQEDPPEETKEKPISKTLKLAPQLEELSEEAMAELQSLQYPKKEIEVDRSDITPVEKYLFSEFFEGRPTKTSTRYLYIRNHILKMWNSSKPNYLRKTAIRNGLKQAGDVNCIGKIHTYLEQIGAINFDCDQTNYVRPLLTLFASNNEKPIREKLPVKEIQLPRQRHKKRFNNDGEGGYTLTHNEKGDIINTTVVNEDTTVKPKNYTKKPSIQLIYCKKFTAEYEQKCKIFLDVSALILMDLHAHMYWSEVMGLIGGYYNPKEKTVVIKRYVPCRNLADSSTHCDMCPVSQAEASESIQNDHLDVLGWFHSHPTFAPEPSQQDIDTQLELQNWIGNKTTPCIGFILSPFSLHGALIASPYRCLTVHKESNLKSVPYRFQVGLLSSNVNVHNLLESALNLVSNDSSNSTNKVDFTKMYYHDNSLTYLDKYIYSVKMHLAKCGNLNKMTCDAIIDGLSEICKRRS